MLRFRRLALWISTVTVVIAVALIGTVTPASADIPNVEIQNNVDGLCVMEQGIPNAPVIQSPCTDYPREIWNFTTIGTNLYTINNVAGHCLAGATIWGDAVYAETCDGDPGQRWSIMGTGAAISLRTASWGTCLVRANSVVNAQLVISGCPTKGGQWVYPDYD